MASIVYISSSTTDVITEIASTSEVIISNLQGPQGATGPTGPQGAPGGIASVVAPITNAGTETAAIIGINSSSANTANYVVQRDANKEFVAGAVTIDTTLTPTSAPGKLYWDGGGTVNLGLAGGNVSVALGENLVSYVTNAEATTLAVGEVVYAFGSVGNRISVKRATNALEGASSKTLGIVAESIAAGGTGFVIVRGIIDKLTLGAYTEGQTIYLGATAGTFTATKPVAPANLVVIGIVVRANNGNGEMYVNIQNGFELEELHNVSITSAANGNFLVYDSATELWKNQAISATAPVTYNAGTRTIAANSASTSASGVVQLSDSTSTTSSVLAATPTAVKAAYDLASTANATANAAIPATQKAAANGVATLDASGLVPTNQLPALAITNTFVVASQAAMLALTAQTGDVAIRTDLNKSYILTADPASTLGNWQELLTPPDAVTSVDGRVGAVSLSDLYAAKLHASTHASGGTDAVTLAQSQITNLTTDLAAKAPLASPALTGVPTSTTAAVDTNTTQIATTAYVVGQGYLKSATASSTYAPIASPTFTGTLTTPIAVVTGSTVPSNGIYLPAANTLGLATNSTVRLQIDSVGNVGIGTTNATQSLRISKNLTGGTTVYGVAISATIQSDVTNSVFGYGTFLSTAAAAFSTNLNHYTAQQGTIGATSSLSSQVGYRADPSLTGATANYGFYGDISSGTGRWNFYANGTAANYFAGQTTIGSTSLTLGSGSVAQQFGIVAGAATTVGVVIRGAASATANLTEWQNSAGSLVARLESTGKFVGYQNIISLGSIHSYNLITSGTNETQYSSAIVSVGTVATTNVGIVTRGITSQSADLLQLQNSNGTVLDAFGADGLQRSQAQLIQYGAEGSLLQNIPNRIHPAETLLKQAVWWIDSAHSGSSGQTIKNLGWGGSALDATAGSTTSADSNDPQYLEWSGVNYVYLPGSTSNLLSIPDANNLDITTDIDIRAYIAMDDWTPSAQSTILSKWSSSTDLRSWIFRIRTDGKLEFVSSADGTTSITRTSTVAPTVTDGSILWVRVALDVDNGASGNDVVFYTSTNGTTWTQLGTTVTTAGTTTIFSSATEVRISGFNATGTTEPIAGKVYRALILNGIDGVPVLDVDTSVIASGAATSFTALTGQTVTINRSTSGRKTTVVTHPVWLFGTDDYMEVNNRWLERTTANYLYLPGVAGNYASAPDSAALDITGDIDLRCKVAMDDWTPSATLNFIGKALNTTELSFTFAVQTDGKLRLNVDTDGTAPFAIGVESTAATGISDGATKWVRVTRVASTGVVQFFLSDDGTTWTQLGTDVTGASGNIYSGTAALNVGSSNNGANQFARGKFFRAQILNGIGGTVAFDANFETGITTNLPTTFTESSANAATVTINYSGTGYRSAGVIASTYVFPGATNTFKLSSYSMLDFGASDDFTVVAISRLWNNQSAAIISKATDILSSMSGYLQWLNTGAVSFRAGDGTTRVGGVTSGAITLGSTTTLSFVRSVGSDNFTSYTNATAGTPSTDTTTGTLANIYPLRVGQTATSPNQVGITYIDMEFVSAAIFRRALTAAEIATLNSYFQGRVA